MCRVFIFALHTRDSLEVVGVFADLGKKELSPANNKGFETNFVEQIGQVRACACVRTRAGSPKSKGLGAIMIGSLRDLRYTQTHTRTYIYVKYVSMFLPMQSSMSFFYWHLKLLLLSYDMCVICMTSRRRE